MRARARHEKANVELVVKKLGAYTAERESHLTAIIIGNAAESRWKRVRPDAPPAVVARAKSVLAKLEAGRDATGGIAAGLDDLPLFASSAEPEHPTDALADAVGAIDPDALTPREALEALYRLKHLWAERSGQ